jgi:hypothetical protein
MHIVICHCTHKRLIVEDGPHVPPCTPATALAERLGFGLEV